MELRTFGGKEIDPKDIGQIVRGGISGVEGTLVQLKNGQQEFLKHSEAEVLNEIKKEEQKKK